MKITIIGAGNTAVAAACFLTKRSVFRASSIPAVKNGQNSGINFP